MHEDAALRCDNIGSSHVPLDCSLEFKVVVHDSQLSEILEFMGALKCAMRDRLYLQRKQEEKT
jgi:hypothetical protein